MTLEAWMPFLTGLAAVILLAWVVQAWMAVLLLRRLVWRLSRPLDRGADPDFKPSVALIVPFKGIDPEQESQIDALFEQAWPNYRLCLVVESESDAAVPMLRDAMAAHARLNAAPPVELFIAGVAPPTEGQKVHNLRHVLGKLWEHHGTESGPPDIVAFADSDAIPGSHWLGDLIAPLARPNIGCATGYRWLFPVRGGNNRRPDQVTIWSRFASILNASTVTFLGKSRFARAWGGSMAMRRDTLEAGDYHGRLAGSISDDMTAWAMCRDLGLRTYFVRECLVRSPIALDRREMFSFVMRQHVFVRTFDPLSAYLALVVAAIYAAGLSVAWWVLGSVISGRAGGDFALLAPLAILTIALVLAATVARWRLRRRAVHAAFGADGVRDLRGTWAVDLWLTPVWMLLHGGIMVWALLTRNIRWRGRRYRVQAPQTTVLLD